MNFLKIIGAFLLQQKIAMNLFGRRCFYFYILEAYWSGLAFPPLVNHVLSALLTMTRPPWVALHGMTHGFIELHKPLHHNKAVIHEGDRWSTWLSKVWEPPFQTKSRKRARLSPSGLLWQNIIFGGFLNSKHPHSSGGREIQDQVAGRFSACWWSSFTDSCGPTVTPRSGRGEGAFSSHFY